MTEWINIKEKFPQIDEIVVAWLSDIEEPAVVKYTVDEKGGLWTELVDIDRFDFTRESRITHWMPLPKRPEEI